MMRCGLLGEKLGHSYSPAIHAQLADYAYGLYEVAPEDLPAFLTGGDFDALNVTIPYKKAVIPYCAELSPIAQKLGSVNVLVRRADGTYVRFDDNAAVLHEKFIPGNPRDKAAVRNKIHRFLRAAYKHRFTNCLINKPENTLNESFFAEKELNSVFSQIRLELNAKSTLRAALKIRRAFGIRNTFVHKKITHILKSYHVSGWFATVFLYNSKSEKIFRFPLAKLTGMLYN